MGGSEKRGTELWGSRGLALRRRYDKYRGTALCISRTSSSRVEATKMNLSSTSSSVSTRKFGYGIDDSMADPSNYHHLLHQMCLCR
jgi:hypothetical protein